MTALTASSTFSDSRAGGLISGVERLPVAANAVLYLGAIVGLLDGYAVSLAAYPQAKPVGRANGSAPGETDADDVDNTGGSNGDIHVLVERGVFLMKNSATVAALVEADTGENCYFVDDQTVARHSNNGNRPVVGTFLGFDEDTSQPWVAVGLADQERVIETGLAGANLTAHKYGFVKFSGGSYTKAGAGELAVGILQNAPDNGDMARVCVFGPSLCKAGGVGFTVGLAVASDANGLGCDATKAIIDSTTTVGAALGAFTDPPSAAEMAALRTFVNQLRTDVLALDGLGIKGSNAMGVARETAAAAETKIISVGKMGLVPTTTA